MITISEFMTTELCTLRGTNTINDAMQIMAEKHIRHIPITDNDNRLLGLVTQRDVLAANVTALASAGNDSPTVKADVLLSEIMTQNISVVSPADSLRQAAMYLQQHKYGCLPVVSEEGLVGIITDSDFVAIAVNLLEQAELIEDMPEIEIDDIGL